MPNEWEQIITAMHWRDGKPTDFSEQGLIDALKNNAPCITAFGLKKSFGDAEQRKMIGDLQYQLDKYIEISRILLRENLDIKDYLKDKNVTLDMNLVNLNDLYSCFSEPDDEEEPESDGDSDEV